MLSISYSFLWEDVPHLSIFFVEKIFFLNHQRKILHEKSHKVRRHLTTCLNLFFKFLQKLTVFIFLFHITIKWTLIILFFSLFSAVVVCYTICLRVSLLPEQCCMYNCQSICFNITLKNSTMPKASLFWQ